MNLTFITILRRLLTPRDKKVLTGLLIGSIFISIVETIGISAIMVFVSIATNFDIVTKNTYLSPIYQWSGFTQPAHFVIALGALLISFYLFRALVNTIHIYAMSTFASMRQHYFATQMFTTYLNLSYKDFVAKNSTSISQVIFSYSGNLTQVINGLLSIATELFTVGCIYGMLFYVNWKMTLVLSIFLTLKVFIVIRTFSPRIAAAGKRSRDFTHTASRTYTESFWNFKFLKLLSWHQPIINRFTIATHGLSQANAVNIVWQSLPRFVLETIGFIMLISAMMYVLFMYNNASFIIPMVSMYALAFYRFLPSINKIVAGYNQIVFNKHAAAPIYEFLQQKFEKLGTDHITFNKQVSVTNLTFSYGEKSEVLHDAALTITKGERIGFIGESGSGKSTLIDILMGLLSPQAGTITIDNVLLTEKNVCSWRQKIGYIPQTIFLFDGTVADNIASGRAYDEQTIIAVLKKAHMYDFLQTKNGINTWIGENGINLSGGQKQRIAIARALYSDPDILVLDEATSALDNDTEEKIMQEIYHTHQDKTLLIIAHRLTTIERCDRVYKIENKKIKEHREQSKTISTDYQLHNRTNSSH